MKKGYAGPADYLIFLGQVAASLDSDFLREAEALTMGHGNYPLRRSC